MVIILKKGDMVRERLTAFFERNRINSGFFYGIGGVVDPMLSFYDIKNKKYTKKRFAGHYEVVSMTGNLTQEDGGISIHAHTVLADKNHKTVGGHFMDAEVAITLELKFTQTEILERRYDKETGLNLLP